ncbi:MAG: hypothetical protein US25_C0028G0009 [Candidatus Moranbacteria bacterium GW2011_GWE1_36_7]|nr:MAG: hypothetical protein UR99_C0042G0001 [Candidatus Moranbacteria bacterium GW2011_GWD2_36_12]KKQ05020.1 MAG: hypothetical protein US16_C0040G0001 [Candidatus Moranbacteria bacterium GW2011_GWE2_36_40]KKQ14259.1 MAG: hypothetical protein US25_C0028G0009 [Candidatus Moranbacteria bacterium GW2011_GWE1_36_7]
MEEDIKQAQVEESTKEEKSESAGSNGSQNDIKSMMSKLEEMLDEYMIKKAPFAILTGGKEFIVSVSPYLIVIFAIMALPIIFAAIGLSAVMAPFAMMGGYPLGHGWGFGAIISSLFAIATVIIELVAVPGLFKRTRNAWRLVFYASVISLIGNVLVFNIIGGIIGAIIGWYILFQVKELYKN